ncbi:MAG: iron-sulfur cluster assembly accessory protein [Alphaproteobacteria bacterium]|nr:iron-sulfur cluster assembly accessory protein [Alphaproteobacteria bacterium]
MTSTAQTDTIARPGGPAFGVTGRAAARVAEILAAEPPGTMLRIAVEGGGCSGFQYSFTFETSRGPDDRLIERDGAAILVDELSLGYMSGAELDFVDELIGAAFRINNPLAKSACGCGTSFSL